MQAHLFIGPTAAEIPPSALAGFHRHGPVEAGVIDAVKNNASEPGQIILVDGNLEPGQQITNAELLNALQAGWKIWGLASVGALKAAALHRHGLRGFGWIARYARLYPQRAENEVAALYFPTPPYAPASEPLIELRLLLRALRRRKVITHTQEQSLAQRLTAAPLEERTFDLVAHHHPAAREIPMHEWQVKRRDLLAFLHHLQKTLPS